MGGKIRMGVWLDLKKGLSSLILSIDLARWPLPPPLPNLLVRISLEPSLE
jgi:hypothetical protein